MGKHFLAVLFVLSLANPAMAAWESGFSERQKITFTSDTAKISGTLSNFPTLISLTLDNLKTTANGGCVTNSNGYDIRFTASDGTTDLTHELERYNAATGELITWVKLPSLTAGTVIYMYYGNSAITTNPSSSDVWDSAYIGVYHMDDSGPNIDDSCASDRDAAKDDPNNPSLAEGKIGYAEDFDGIGNSAEMSQTAFNDLTEVTLSAWIRMDTWGKNGQGRILDKTIWYFRVDETNKALYYWQNTTNASTEKEWRTATNVLTTGSWYHVGLVYKHDRLGGTTGPPLIYINGTSQSITELENSGWDSLADAGYHLYMGNDRNDAKTFDGMIDEVRVSQTKRGAGWINASYHNQSDPASFYSLSQTIAVDLRSADDGGDYTNWAIGSSDVSAVAVMNAANCVLVKNTGDLAQDFSIRASASNWTLAGSNGTDTAVLMALFNGGSAPAAGDFSVATDVLGTSEVWSTTAGGSGIFEGTSSGAGVQADSGEQLYLYLETPAGTTTSGQEIITVTIGCRAAQ